MGTIKTTHALSLVMLLAGMVCAARPAVSAARTDQGTEDVETLEEIEEVEVVAPQGDGGTSGAVSLIGRLHPLLVHFPIAWIVLLLLVDGLAFGLKRDPFRAMGLPLLGITLLSFVPAVATGLLNASLKDPATAHLAAHRNAALLATLLVALALGLRWFRRTTGLRGRALVAYLALVGLAAATVSFAGHMGGKMVFGDDYLPF